MTGTGTSSGSKPWLKDWLTPSNLISLIALVVSLITAAYTLPIQYNQDIRAKEEQLRQIIINLLDLDKELQESILPIKDPIKQFNAGSLLNSKRQVYLNTAEIIASQIPDNVTASQYIILASQRFRDANYQLAKDYFEKAIDVSKKAPKTRASILNQHYALRNLATFYYQNQPLRSFEEGKNYFSEAIRLLESGNDDTSLYVLGETYEIWGIANLYNNFKEDGYSDLEKAKKYYLSLPISYNPSPQQLIGRLNQIKKTINNSSQKLETSKPSLENNSTNQLLRTLPSGTKP
jgi:tetratricopeptide (TPR) repeat protein